MLEEMTVDERHDFCDMMRDFGDCYARGIPCEECELYDKDYLEGDKKMNVMLDAGARLPEKAHKTDAGYDLFSREDAVVPAFGSAIFDTGVHIELPVGTVGFIAAKSGLNVKHGIVSFGVIDVGYTGSMVVKLYNISNTDYEVKKGDKISQLVVFHLADDDKGLTVVSEFSKTDRGDNGFGSSGR